MTGEHTSERVLPFRYIASIRQTSCGDRLVIDDPSPDEDGVVRRTVWFDLPAQLYRLPGRLLVSGEDTAVSFAGPVDQLDDLVGQLVSLRVNTLRTDRWTPPPLWLGEEDTSTTSEVQP